MGLAMKILMVASDDASTVPCDLAPGEDSLVAGMYKYPSLERLSITGADGHALGDHLSLGNIVLNP
jgi:hypothetical protein